jgi:hypothetical protein
MYIQENEATGMTVTVAHQSMYLKKTVTGSLALRVNTMLPRPAPPTHTTQYSIYSSDSHLPYHL